MLLKRNECGALVRRFRIDDEVTIPDELAVSGAGSYGDKAG
jgi:hypothetical protein